MEELQVNLDNTLGSGKFGTIYRVEYHGSLVALKAFGKTANAGSVFSEEARTDFMTDCQVVQRCNHDNIVQYLATAKVSVGGVTYPALLMTLMDVSLRNYLAFPDAQNLAPYKEVKIANDIAQALNYLHEFAELVHGDLHSGNVLLRCISAHEGPLVKLCDFGLAKIITNISEKHRKLHGMGSAVSITTVMSVDSIRASVQDSGYTSGENLVESKKSVTPQGAFEKSSTASGGKLEDRKKAVTPMNPRDLEIHRFGTIMWSIQTRLDSLTVGTTADKNLQLIANRPLHDIVRDCWSNIKPSAKDLLERFSILKMEYPVTPPDVSTSKLNMIIESQQKTIASQQTTIEKLQKKIAELEGR